MAADYYSGTNGQDPYDPEAAIRARVLGSLSPDPSYNLATETPSPSTRLPSPPDFAAGTTTDAVMPSAPAAAAPVLGVDRSTGGVAQTQSGYAPVGNADLSQSQAPIASSNFVNANTGAAAHYDPATGMYIDTNGQAIRPDAIRVSGGSSPAAAASPITAASPATSGSGVQSGTSDWQNAIRQIIMSRLTADQQPIDENSPQIQAVMNAAKDQQTRQNDLERTQLAERLYAQGGGLNTDAVTQGVQQSNERTGTALSQLRANLLMGQYKDRYTELNHLLDLATQSGDAESARGIQAQIANLQAAVQREGLGINLAEFGQTMNQNAAFAGLNG